MYLRRTEACRLVVSNIAKTETITVQTSFLFENIGLIILMTRGFSIHVKISVIILDPKNRNQNTYDSFFKINYLMTVKISQYREGILFRIELYLRMYK
jgi:hypothetical protein